MKLTINNVQKYYGEKESRVHVLKGINCEVGDGEICVLLGPSGSGKSTLLNIIGGLESADEGCIDIGSFCTDRMTEKDLVHYRRDNLGFVFQFYNLVPNLTIRENIEVCAYLTKNPLDMDELLETLGLTEHQHKFPNQLSGGQQQRCAIGRALIKNPPLLLFDEPTGALDYTTSKDILELIETINEKYHNAACIAKTISREDLLGASSQMMDSFESVIQFINIFSVVVYLVIIYIMTKVVIEKNTIPISYMKVFGYQAKEIRKLYLTATTIVVFTSLIVCIPLEVWLFKKVLIFLSSLIDGYIAFYLPTRVYLEIVIIGVAAYLFINALHVSSVKKIPMTEALKNRE